MIIRKEWITPYPNKINSPDTYHLIIKTHHLVTNPSPIALKNLKTNLCFWPNSGKTLVLTSKNSSTSSTNTWLKNYGGWIYRKQSRITLTCPIHSCSNLWTKDIVGAILSCFNLGKSAIYHSKLRTYSSISTHFA